MSKLYTNKLYLTKRYLVEKKTLEEIGKECGVSHQTIYRYLVKFGLIRDQRKFGKK
jgi:DNA-directed RNA polymerase specialized sigma subunit